MEQIQVLVTLSSSVQQSRKFSYLHYPKGMRFHLLFGRAGARKFGAPRDPACLESRSVRSGAPVSWFGGLLCYIGSAEPAGKLSNKKSTNASKMVRTVHVAANLHPCCEQPGVFCTGRCAADLHVIDPVGGCEEAGVDRIARRA